MISDYSYDSTNRFHSLTKRLSSDRTIRSTYIRPVLPYLQSKMLSFNEIIFDQP